ncbi:transporter substrate-binding domain-containing protein [Chelatococcus asaccharovorans]|uniref:Amino acid ABC transporter substrate-binding protein (PAAT family) n=1 Tax=Chelatococcus asaccharovorans TaxID=28210 RepID=A0A2V3UF28_9HYPH|nr:transporter substrate-binding domain-containing protein [Chelatococcus asaccharovorans]MBS7707437.1 transporter substrate-binding domain-containing protein [Chelatococcus asaccharovorans]PXW63617.1 amino acid ABC transporter substrate-binding protein (PAAT family) [Chelatococcus asaccharovorans]CAH1650113.1 Amino acid ABC transporter substrate-binding protein (PAAT family) [Chelatococcus asaccharovorans]CAH1692051.1 Amino acid ABC transporter substrate-binding protein (PAAT family) [Chelatoc
MHDIVGSRRNLFKSGLVGGLALAATAASARTAAAQAAPNSLLRTVLDRGKLIVGTGSTNAPWHFEDDNGQLAGMDIAMGRILAKGLFDDDKKVEFVRQDAAQRIPNINTGKVDIVIQFMTMSPARAQLIAFSRPYYVEGIALLTRPDSDKKTFDALLAAGSSARVSILQNVDAEASVRKVLPQANVMQLDSQANVILALDSKRADAAAVDLSTVWWLSKRHPDKYADAGKSWNSMLYGAGMKQGDPDWVRFVNTTFDVAIHGHQNEIYDSAIRDYFGIAPPARAPGLPKF